MGNHQAKQTPANRANTIKRAKLALSILLCGIAVTASCFLVGCSSSSAEGSKSSDSSAFASEPAEPTVINSLETETKPAEPESSSSAPIPNPIDFNELINQNPDVYAWVYLPDSSVNLPVLQHPLADNYYLVHDMHDAESATGAIYTQFVNKRDFSDPVTVIYGHTFEEWSDLKDEMFGTLHLLEDKAFFDSHPYFYIFTPNRLFKYEIVSAYEYDDRHIMNSFDFTKKKVVQKYFDYVVNPDSLVKNVRKDVHLDAAKDKIVQLSTCTRPANDSARYIVTGVLVDSQQFAA